jgi:hypothetical protein
MELILGLPSLSQYDATATPMWRLFSSTPDTAPYTAIPQAVTTGMTGASAFGAKISAQMNWAIPDAGASPALNRILWHAIKGANTAYPGPDPYGIPLPQVSHYVWGSLTAGAYPLQNLHGDPKLHIVDRLSTKSRGAR